MMRTYLPVALAVVLIVGLTYSEAMITDRWSGSNISAEEFASRFANVPETIGSWEGEDQVVTAEIQKGAGAVDYVSRVYTNTRTKESVRLWLIVGHARDICRHTPDVCFPASGFRSTSDKLPYTIEYGSEESADFFTTTFLRESHQGREFVRVFWSWAKPEEEQSQLSWEAPEYQRLHYGNTRALYKMYFTTVAGSENETAEKSPSVTFAKQFLPQLNAALLEDQPL